MFYRYEIINNGKEDILYLYLDMKYEFSKELIGNDFNDLSRRTKNFINTNNINFKGKKVFLIVDGIVVKTVDISNITGNPYKINSYDVDNFNVNIEMENHHFSEMCLRDYLLNQLFFYYNYSLHNEVLKAICVLFNTYAYNMMNSNGYIPYNDSFSNYDSLDDAKNTIPNYDEIIAYFNELINEISCLFLTYNDNYILPFIHYSNNGYTMTNKKYPYLSSVKCLWDLTSPYYIKYHDYDYKYLSSLLNITITNKSSIKITRDYDCKKIIINNKKYSYDEFKKLINLDSSDIYIILYNNYLRIITCGCGNFYGLSLYAANEIAKNGAKYYSILSYFFPKTKLYTYTKKEQ